MTLDPKALPEADRTLLDLLALAIVKFAAMTPEQREEHLRLQCESWVRGEMGIGNDEAEAQAWVAYLSPPGSEPAVKPLESEPDAWQYRDKRLAAPEWRHVPDADFRAAIGMHPDIYEVRPLYAAAQPVSDR